MLNPYGIFIVSLHYVTNILSLRDIFLNLNYVTNILALRNIFLNLNHVTDF